MNNKVFYIFFGMIGSGKSTLVREVGLESNVISMDTLRLINLPPHVSEDGMPETNNTENQMIAGKFKDLLHSRLAMGGILVSDNLNSKLSFIAEQAEIADIYNYDVKVVAFPDRGIDFYLEIDKQRGLSEPLKYCGERQVRRNHDKFLNTLDLLKSRSEEDGWDVISVEEFRSQVSATYKDMVVDLSNYQNVHVFGDLQGCFDPLMEFLDSNPYSENDFYILLGDYIDRGIQNDKVLEFLFDFSKNENVVLIRGNHERHLEYYLRGVYRSREFQDKTLPQLKGASISKGQIKEFTKGLVDFYLAKKVIAGEEQVLFFNHAGINTVPERPQLYGHNLYYRGVGGYEHNIDRDFTNTIGDQNIIQFHGHRNFEPGVYRKGAKSFSLEYDIEFGGYLSVFSLNESGIQKQKIKNNYYRHRGVKMLEFKNNLRVVEDLRSSHLINERELNDYISSFSFTKKAFFDKAFDDELVCKARGLFVNVQSGEIVSRSYDKFFNAGENGIKGHSHDELKERIQGRTTLFDKENGFLGIVGYDSVADTLFISSKSTTESDFAGYFRDIFDDTFDEYTQISIKEYLRTKNKSLVFEVNDPVNDPHIIEYDKPHIVLLESVERSMDFSCEPYDQLKKLADKWGCKVKRRAMSFDNADDLFKFIEHQANSLVSDGSAKELEGYIALDESGFMFKIKLPHYNFWKVMRSQKERVCLHVRKGKTQEEAVDLCINKLQDHFLINEGDRQLAIDFCRYLGTKPVEVLKAQSILELKNEFTELSDYNLRAKRSLNEEGRRQRRKI